MTTVHQGHSKDHRLTFGFLAISLDDPRIHHMWLGALDAAQAQDINLICFAVGNVGSETTLKQEPGAVLCDLIDPQRLDGLIVAQYWASETWFDRFYDRYRPLPVVVLGRHYAGYPGIKGDGDRGLQELLKHLIIEHGYTRFGYLRAQKNDVEESRYHTFCEYLARHGCVVDPRCVTPPDTRGQEHPVLGKQGIRLLFDERKLTPGHDLEVLVSYDNGVAEGAVEALKSRGIQVPGDIALTGFDSNPSMELTIPPLTSSSDVRYEHGWHAIEQLLTVIENKTACPHKHLTLTPIIRESCGCMSASVMRAGITFATQHHTHEFTDADWQAHLIQDIAEQCNSLWEAFTSHIEQLIPVFVKDVSSAAPEHQRLEHFLWTIETLVYNIARAGKSVDLGHDLLSVLHAHGVVRWPLESPQRSRLESLVHQARVLVSEIGRWSEELQRRRFEEQTEKLRQIGQQLTSIFDLPAMTDVLAEHLPDIGVPGAALALYVDPEAPAADARLMLAYTEEGRQAVPSDGAHVISGHLVPPETWLGRHHQTAAVVEPLYFGLQQAGFILLEVGPRGGEFYESVRKEISSALQGVMLVQKVRENAAEIARQKYILDTFMANVPDTIYFKDRESRFTKINRALASLLGIDDPDDAIGKSDFDFLAKAEAQPKYEQEQAIIESGTPILALEESHLGDRWSLTTKMPLRDEADGIIGTFGISRDITPLKRAQAELEQRSFDLAASYEEIQILNEQLNDENLRMGAELDVARRLQTMLLPPPEELRQIERLDIVGYMQPADEVGGDYYDVLQTDSHLHIGIGDVTGHGLESGVLMLMTQTAIRTLIEHGETDPVKFVTTLNRTIYKNAQRMRADKTLTFMLVNYADKQLKVVGQHEELLIVRAGGCVEHMDTIDLGFPIGLEEDIAQWVASSTVTLEPGDGCVLYTDGITEAENMHKELYGLERLCAVIRRHWHNSAEKIQQAVVDDLMQYIGEQKVYDDVTLVVLKQL